MLNLERFNREYNIQLIDIKDAELVRELNLTLEQLEKGFLVEVFEDEIINKVDNYVVEVKGGIYEDGFSGGRIGQPIICNVFVNGIVAKDLEKELGL